MYHSGGGLMARRISKKARQARGFLFDENVPAEVSRYFGSRRFRVAHIGISGPGYAPAPIKGTADAGLRPSVQEWIFVTLDKNLLQPGRFPNEHRGVFVLDTSDGGSALEVSAPICETFHSWWKDDRYFRNRRFVFGKGGWEERGADNSVIDRGTHR